MAFANRPRPALPAVLRAPLTAKDAPDAALAFARVHLAAASIRADVLVPKAGGRAAAALDRLGLRAIVVQSDVVPLLKAMGFRDPDAPPPGGTAPVFDLTVTSPPYEDARQYGALRFSHTGEAWAKWAFPIYAACVHATRGLTAWVVDSRTKNYRWSAAVARLTVALDDRGYCLRRPVYYHRSGISGSGGPDWFRNDCETVLCATRLRGRLPWSDNTACGGPPKYPPGGPPSHRTKSGARVKRRAYVPPDRANPGNVLRCLVGRGHMGSLLAHSNEAPYPVRLPDFFIRSCCRPGGVVFDPFAGSGTTAQAAIAAGRSVILVEQRADQARLSVARIAEAAINAARIQSAD